MNVTPAEAGVISSLMISILVLGVVMIAGRGGKSKNKTPVGIATIPITMFFCILFFVYIGWFPVWTGSIIAMVLVIFVAYVFGKVAGVT